jgi:hypothetical protein
MSRFLARTRIGRALSLFTKLARVSIFLAVLLAASMFVGTKVAASRVEEKGMDLGRQLSSFRDLLGGTHQVLLNGEHIYLASKVTDLEIGAILDRFERHCRENSGGIDEELSRSSQGERVAVRAPAAWELRFGTLRRQNDHEGMVACIAREHEPGLAGMLAALTRVMKTGELHDFGNLRYAYARRTDDGAHTHLITTFTEGSFNLYGVLGREGREPGGSDPPGAPRPPNAQRMFSASVDGSPYGLQSYTTSDAPARVVQFYNDEMPKRGWRKLAKEEEIFGSSIWSREGIFMGVSALQLDDEDKTIVMFTEGSNVNPPLASARVR